MPAIVEDVRPEFDEDLSLSLSSTASSVIRSNSSSRNTSTAGFAVETAHSGGRVPGRRGG